MYFTEEHNLFRKSLQDFLQKEVVPYIEKWEKTGNIDRFIWKKFGDMGVTELRKLKSLEDENKRLKSLVADLSLDKQILQDVLSKKL